MLTFISELINHRGLKILLIVISLDTIFGILRAIKEKKINSGIGIDGIIRKVGMLISILFLYIIDNIVTINLIGFIPQNFRELINLEKVGIADLFNILYIVFETLSILKNAVLCKLPIPTKLQLFLEKIMKEFTEEIKEKEEN